MDKNIFQIMKEINEADNVNKTQNLHFSPYFLRSQKTNKGGEVTVGVSSETFNEIYNDNMMVVLIAMNKIEYNRIKD